MEPTNSEGRKAQTEAVLSRGSTVAHYTIIEKIGAGGMGEVYLAEDTRLNRRVALKFLPLQLSSDEELKARFKREAQAAAALTHPNIVTIHEVNEFQGRAFFAMEYVKGESLAEMLKSRQAPLDEIVGIAIQTCEGLREAHEAGVIHRDIKPSNI